MLNISNTTIYSPWQSFNTTCPSYEDVYMKAYKAVGEQFGTYLIFFAVVVVVDWVAIALFNRDKMSLKRFKQIIDITTALKVFWVFTLIGMYFMGI